MQARHPIVKGHTDPRDPIHNLQPGIAVLYECVEGHRGILAAGPKSLARETLLPCTIRHLEKYDVTRL